MPETKVFIGGSRKLSRLNADLKHRIDAIIGKRFTIMVGDANGADKAVQRYLAEQNYQNVSVFCMVGDCRNNIGNWPIRVITAAKGARGFAFYSTKDRAMIDEASHGLMLWDGESKGTLNSIVSLVRQRKPVVVYFAPERTYLNVRTVQDVTDLLMKCDRASVQRFERELDIAHTLQGTLLP